MRHNMDNPGFTLVEVMVSLVIFLIASMGLLPLLLTNIQANQAVGMHAKASRLAAEAMTELQHVEYTQLGSLSGASRVTDSMEVERFVERDNPVHGQSKITVTTHWQLQGRSHSYQLQAIRSAP